MLVLPPNHLKQIGEVTTASALPAPRRKGHWLYNGGFFVALAATVMTCVAFNHVAFAAVYCGVAWCGAVATFFTRRADPLARGASLPVAFVSLAVLIVAWLRASV